jgi:uncharacterized protein YqgC (DUF456 family)
VKQREVPVWIGPPLERVSASRAGDGRGTITVDGGVGVFVGVVVGVFVGVGVLVGVTVGVFVGAWLTTTELLSAGTNDPSTA